MSLGCQAATRCLLRTGDDDLHTDSPKQLKKKIGNAFTGGAVSAEEQRKTGGRPEMCAVFKYQFYLFESDDAKVDDLADRCRKGEILCGECRSCSPTD